MEVKYDDCRAPVTRLHTVDVVQYKGDTWRSFPHFFTRVEVQLRVDHVDLFVVTATNQQADVRDLATFARFLLFFGFGF